MEIGHCRALSTLLNTTYGKGGSQTGTMSVTAALAGDSLTLTYTSVVHFAEERSLQMQVDRLTHESISYLTDMVSRLKKDFKEMTGDTLKAKEIKSNDSIELVSGLALRKVAYYRRTHVLEVY